MLLKDAEPVPNQCLALVPVHPRQNSAQNWILVMILVPYLKWIRIHRPLVLDRLQMDVHPCGLNLVHVIILFSNLPVALCNLISLF